jgi:cytidylate kinase
MDGRDIGSVVFPSAEIKLWVTASVAVRAERRFKELKAKNEKVTIQEVAQNIEKRDFEDSNREISPLIKPKNAIEIDNSLLTIQETLSSSMHFINAYLLINN